MTEVGLPPSLKATLPGRYYTDPELFAREQSRIFEAMWFAAVRAADLAEPGAFRTVTVGSESVIVLRDRDGMLRAFLNICRHRGATLCQQESGQVRRNLQCMYHAWTYALDGTLVAAPNLATMRDIDHRVRADPGVVAGMAGVRLGLPGR